MCRENKVGATFYSTGRSMNIFISVCHIDSMIPCVIYLLYRVYVNSRFMIIKTTSDVCRICCTVETGIYCTRYHNILKSSSLLKCHDNAANMTILKSPAARMLQRRAIQCSFSSVLHLRAAGMQPREANLAETVFLSVVGLPLAVMGATGLWYSTQ